MSVDEIVNDLIDINGGDEQLEDLGTAAKNTNFTGFIDEINNWVDEEYSSVISQVSKDYNVTQSTAINVWRKLYNMVTGNKTVTEATDKNSSISVEKIVKDIIGRPSNGWLEDIHDLITVNDYDFEEFMEVMDEDRDYAFRDMIADTAYNYKISRSVATNVWETIYDMALNESSINESFNCLTEDKEEDKKELIEKIVDIILTEDYENVCDVVFGYGPDIYEYILTVFEQGEEPEIDDIYKIIEKEIGYNYISKDIRENNKVFLKALALKIIETICAEEDLTIEEAKEKCGY